MKIESGIPIPPRAYPGGNGRPVSELGEVVRALQPGESVLLETERDADRMRSLAGYVGIKLIRRKIREGWRVWRVE